MGYRSNVRIATTTEGYDAICEFVDEASKGSVVEQLVGKDAKPEFFQEKLGCVVFGWDWVKWYVGDLEDVSNVMDALREIESHGIPYEFCRIGENWDDVELDKHDDEWKLTLHVEPEVTFNIWD